MTKSKKRNKLVLLALLTSLTFFATREREYEPDYEIVAEESDDNPVARYSKGNIYIGTQDYIDYIKPYVNEGDILIIDFSATDDPNFKILDSYLIEDRDLMTEILEVIIAYSDLHPSDWNRSLESMRNEYIIHNILYNFNYEIDRTSSVDLNNADEEKYDSKLLSRILFN